MTNKIIIIPETISKMLDTLFKKTKPFKIKYPPKTTHPLYKIPNLAKKTLIPETKSNKPIINNIIFQQRINLFIKVTEPAEI